jgi:NADH-quinone oxidoreductase subunit J
MDISPVFFSLFAGLAIACALMVVLKKNPVSSAFSLVLVFFSFAGIYALLDAHLIAALQVLVYAGAIMVLFIFVIMLLNADAPSFDMGRSHIAMKIAAPIGSLVLLALFVSVFRSASVTALPTAVTVAQVEAAGGNSRVLSELLFSEYVLPFELTSVLLLCAIVGSVAIAKRSLVRPGVSNARASEKGTRS